MRAQQSKKAQAAIAPCQTYLSLTATNSKKAIAMNVADNYNSPHQISSGEARALRCIYLFTFRTYLAYIFVISLCASQHMFYRLLSVVISVNM